MPKMLQILSKLTQTLCMQGKALHARPCLAVLSGGLAVLAFNVPSLWFIIFFALIPTLYFLYNHARSTKEAFLHGYLFGFIFMGGVISWFWSTYPLSWAGLDSIAGSVVAIFLVWLVSALIFGLFIGLWAGVLWKFKQNKTSDVFLIPSLWILFEYARALAFSVLWAGSTTIIGANWTFGFLGYTLAESSIFVSLASIGGVYLLGFVVVLINVLFLSILISSCKARPCMQGLALQELPNGSRVYVIFVLLIVFIMASFFITNRIYTIDKSTTPSTRVALISTNFPSSLAISEEKFKERMHSLERLLSSIKTDNESPDIIVFPEHSGFLAGTEEYRRNIFLNNILDGKESLIIDSWKSGQAPFESRMYYLNTSTQEVITQSKNFLVPFGEYVPYLASATLKLLGQKNWVDEFNKSRGYERKKADVMNAQINGISVGALFCAEIVPVSLYKATTNLKTDILVNVASQSVFEGSKILHGQILKKAKVRALENNRYFAQAGNMTPSYVIDNRGRIINISFEESGVLYEDVFPTKKDSLYTKYGDIILLLPLFFVLLSFHRSRRDFIHIK